MRPTTAKVLESIIATLAPWTEGARVLDLFAGSGSLGKALIAEGAAEVVFIEGHARVAAALKVPKPHQVFHGVLPAALSRVQGPFDLIVGDPPYGAEAGPECLARAAGLLAPEGVLVWEHHHKDPYADGYGALQLWRRRRFGETAVSYYKFFSPTPLPPDRSA